jgi:hypothetical protein
MSNFIFGYIFFTLFDGVFMGTIIYESFLKDVTRKQFIHRLPFFILSLLLPIKMIIGIVIVAPIYGIICLIEHIQSLPDENGKTELDKKLDENEKEYEDALRDLNKQFPGSEK